MKRREAGIPRPDRLRHIPGGFGWVDHRLRRNGLLRCMTPHDMALYLFLVLAADHNGISWWRLESIDRELGYMGWAEIARSRTRLVALDLIAFEPHSEHDPNGVYQVLDMAEVHSQRHPHAR